MCGIFCCVRRTGDLNLQRDYDECCTANGRRGPDDDSPNYFSEDVGDTWTADFRGWVLWTQGPTMTPQPLLDPSGSVLLWNGDIFSGPLSQSAASDTHHLSRTLQTSPNIPETLASIEGPYSFIYLDKPSNCLYFGRDFLGRHSLLLKITPEKKSLIISSVASKNLSGYTEVPASGIFQMNLNEDHLNLVLFPWTKTDAATDLEKSLDIKIEIKNPILTDENDGISPQFLHKFSDLKKNRDEDDNFGAAEKLDDFSYSNLMSGENGEMNNFFKNSYVSKLVDEILRLLRDSIRLRIEKKPEFCRDCIGKISGENCRCGHSKIGVLFSGGLDSTILAAVATEFIEEGESIDLINVAFERERRAEAGGMKGKKNKVEERSVADIFEVPDRKTGKEAFAELRKIFPRRRWNFVETNVTQAELNIHRRERICHMIYPKKTILDESLGCALWFAARGSGVLTDTKEPYESPCRILLLGMGADELFGGYTRHRTTLRRKGWPGLAEELNLELARISHRNLGRDDRVVSDHGRQSRLPYLDDNFVKFVTRLNPRERCCPLDQLPAGVGDKLLLRLCALKLGLEKTSKFPKRAFQFGSRIAKNHENAGDVSPWL